MNRHVCKKYCRGRHSSFITHLAGQRQGSCAHGFAQGKNNIPGRLPADPVPRLSFVACCPRPLPFLSPPSGASASQCCSRAGSQEWLSRVHRNRAAAKVGHRSASRLRTSSAGGQTPCLCEDPERSPRAPYSCSELRSLWGESRRPVPSLRVSYSSFGQQEATTTRGSPGLSREAPGICACVCARMR